MDKSKVEAYKKYFQELLDKKLLGKRAILNTAPDKKIKKVSKLLKLKPDEEIIIIFDETFFKTYKKGFYFTSWGIYKYEGVKYLDWSLSWEQIANDYRLDKTLALLSRIDNPNNDISVHMGKASFDLKINILIEGCKIFTGKELATWEKDYKKVVDDMMKEANKPENLNIKGLTKLAKQGDAEAQWNLYLRYQDIYDAELLKTNFNSNVINESRENGLYWLKEAAKQGHEKAIKQAQYQEEYWKSQPTYKCGNCGRILSYKGQTCSCGTRSY
jgi:hypothetical protein